MFASLQAEESNVAGPLVAFSVGCVPYSFRSQLHKAQSRFRRTDQATVSRPLGRSSQMAWTGGYAVTDGRPSTLANMPGGGWGW
ncbi:hypothetical protein Cob_v012458 [Colletotrichum orbiculare MAFF 240422]|uniref:Uncharacterized protein n=1 Tax=Colletotrichum orbiculare (strain 104-T / ATCC 96160 / CBS 514.97 / LARS 414 / MAFF 240422) TaxID=1213857 RepID=A0A484F990_COLOR|nr:hypothetical protein Cob_v012458 [Colletotrichum orbiculare MAFF 240422]